MGVPHTCEGPEEFALPISLVKLEDFTDGMKRLCVSSIFNKNCVF